MATKQTRGTKRTCQNDDCDMKFYDLNRDPIVCPDCATVYKLAAVPEEEEIPAVVAAAPVAAPATPAVDGDEVSDDDDALVSLEDADAELGATDDDDDDDDDTFLASDDDDETGVGDIIGGVETEDEES